MEWSPDGWFVPSLKVTAVNSVTVDGVSAQFTAVGGRVSLAWCRRSSSVMANITHGFAECPPDVAAAVVALAKPGLAPVTFGSSTKGPFTETAPSRSTRLSVLADPEALLAPYILPVVG